MRTIIQARERVIEHRTALTNQISNLVHILFPEFHRVFKDIHGKTARMILRECPLPKQLVALGLDQLSKKLYTTSRGRYGQDHARKLMIIARASLGVTDGLEHYVYEIHDLMSLCETIEATIEAYEKKLSDLIRQTPLGRLLLSMRGLGVITITAILGEYNGFAKFVTIAEVLKYAGMDITECSSGKRIGQRHLSKRGRSLLRKMLYLATLNLVRKGSVFYEQYQAYINRNKKKKVALIAIARKALRTIFAMSKSMCEFRENYIREYKTAA
jgi:transposase